MVSSFRPTAEESAIVDNIFSRGEVRDLGFLPGDVALEMFTKTQLPVEILSDIWNIADSDRKGWLTRPQTGATVRLIGWAQAGMKPTPELLEKAGPLAHIHDLSSAASSVPHVPPFTPEHKEKFHKLFISGEPVDGLIQGKKAREMFSKSMLSEDSLSKIWQLADTQHREALDVTDFAIAMHLIQWLMNSSCAVLPEALPKGLYEEAASSPLASPQSTPKAYLSVQSQSPPSSSPRRPSPKPASGSGKPTRRASLSPLPSPSPSRLSPSAPSGSSRRASYSPLQSSRSGEKSGWEIPFELRTRANREFDALDPFQNGSIPDNVSLPFLMESKLPPEDLTSIWVLADLNGDGNLTREGLAIALYLVDERLRGRSIPTTLPSSLKPPEPVREPVKQKPPLIPPKSPKPSGSIKLPRRPPPERPKIIPPPPPAKPPSLSPRSPERSPEPKPSISVFVDHLTPGDAFRRRASSVVYPTLPSQANHARFSSVWPQEDKLLVSSSQLPTHALTNLNPQDIIIAQLNRRIQDMQLSVAQLRVSNNEQAVTLTNVTQENVSLRVVIEELQSQIRSHDLASQWAVNQVLVGENEGLRTALQATKDELGQLQASHTDTELHRIEIEDLRRDNERLHNQVDEMRASTTQLPWSGGDSELQTLINEDLARENARLRLESQEMQDNLADHAEQRRVNGELVQTNERLQTEAQTVRTRFETQRREFDQLQREVEQLRAQLRAGRSHAAQRSHDADIPPPAYAEVPTAMLD
ncbi:hypothetical protein C8F01DRAFT_1364396 [Mycena amicta]|nr:hypothetical protein C8F01DRAFT_1364396 [Mycena amicta]